MKPAMILGLAVFSCLFAASPAHGQGFINLDFESAIVPPGTPLNATLPMATALPGWSGAQYVFYNGISLGGAGLSLIDTNGEFPLQGNYSAYLFGGLGPGGWGLVDVSIFQTGLVPEGSLSLRLDAANWHGFTVSLGGQTLPLVALQTFPASPRAYTRYAADISAFAGQTAVLRITAPGVYGTIPPNALLVDNIVFSPSPVPEPGTDVTLGAAVLALWLLAGRRSSRTAAVE